MNRAEKAEAYFKQGYNCAQAVVLAFADRMGIAEEQALMIASPFGGGMGRLREVCGAVSGMFMVYGAVHGYADTGDLQAKKELYQAVQRMAAEFSEQNGSIVCRELLGVPGAQSPVPDPRGKEYDKKRPCASLVRMAAEIVGRYL